MSSRRALPALILTLALGSAAIAQTPDAPDAAAPAKAKQPRDWSRRFESTFAFVLNPLGIQEAIDVTWSRRLNDSEALIRKDAHVAFGLSSKLTPAFERVGAWVEYSPLSIVDLRVGVEPVYYFGTFKAFLPFARANARFDDDVIEERRPEAASGFAGRIYFAPVLKARAGSVVARVRAEFSRFRAQKAGEPFFYEPAWDTLIRAKGSTVTTLEAVALREFHVSDRTTVLLGPVYDLTRVAEATVNRKQDIGLLAVWSRSGRFHGVKDPGLVAKVFYFLEDPWRRHEPAAQLAVLFAF